MESLGLEGRGQGEARAPKLPPARGRKVRAWLQQGRGQGAEAGPERDARSQTGARDSGRPSRPFLQDLGADLRDRLCGRHSGDRPMGTLSAEQGVSAAGPTQSQQRWGEAPSGARPSAPSPQGSDFRFN